MVKEVLAMDIGIFPLFHVDESLYRGSLKTRVYMSGGSAVIGQRFGENCDLIQDGENGLLAGGNDEWQQSLERLIEDANLRRQLAVQGLCTIRENYTAKHIFAQLVRCLTEVLASR